MNHFARHPMEEPQPPHVAALPHIARLANKARSGAWDMDEVFDWDQDISRPRVIPKKVYTSLISQFLHSERVTSEVCQRNMEIWDGDVEISDFLTEQIKDEDRHAVVYTRYLEKLGDISPVDPILKEGLDAALSWTGRPEARVIAVQILLEGEALRSLDILARRFDCPLFHTINRRIARDEARHVAFGKIFLPSRLKTFEEEERLEIYRWIHKLWHEVAGGAMSNAHVPGMIQRRIRRQWMADGWANHCRALVEVGLIEPGDPKRMHG